MGEIPFAGGWLLYRVLSNNFIKIIIFIIYYPKKRKKMDNVYLYNLIFTFFKFILKNLLFFETMSDTMYVASVRKHFPIK